MTNKDILHIAMAQTAIDSNCTVADLCSTKNKVVLSANNPGARRYLALPFACDLASYGNNIVASVSPELAPLVSAYINRFAPEHCFETPNLHVLLNQLKPFDMAPCFMAEYFLPNIDACKPLSCTYETRILQPADFKNLYLPEWENALSETRKHLDMLGVGAYHGKTLIGLAACSADCDTMWQIGIDVLPAYRKQGIAAALTTQLANAIIAKGIVPFYCCAWSNIKSVRNAIKSGFVPAWVQLTVKPTAFINTINQSCP